MDNKKVKTICIKTLEGLKKAERLQARGWKIVEYNQTYDTVTMKKVE